MGEGEVRYEVAGQAALLTIDRPKARNALSPGVLAGLLEGLRRAEAEPQARVVVVTGAGERVFCAGGDLSSFAGDGFLSLHEGRRAFAELLLAFQRCRKPSVAKLNGHALAGGLGLVMACDLAVAPDDVELGTPELEVGLFPMMVLALLQRHVGRKRALELLLTGRRLPAAEAQGWGLLSRVVPRASLDAATEELVSRLGAVSGATLALGRRAFFTAEDLPLPQALEHLASELSLNVLLEDAAEGVTAFLEKRKPVWKDR